MVSILLIQALTCFFLSQIHQTNDQPDLIWKMARYVSLALIWVQFPMLAFFITLFPAGTVFRFSISMLCISISVGLILAGDNFGRRPGLLFPSVSNMLASLPLQLIGCSIPFLFHKSFSGWRLSSPDHPAKPKDVSILSLLVLTAIIALAFHFLTVGGQRIPVINLAVPLLWVGAGFAFVVPMTILFFRSSRPHFAIFVLGVSVSLLITAIFFLIPFILPKTFAIGPTMRNVLPVLSLLQTVLISFATFVIAIRRSGFEFQTGKTKTKNLQTQI